MIRVDPRIGSGELVKYFKPFGVTVEKTHLDFGDFEFEGYGPKGLCSITFERKRIEDLIDSMQSGRLSGHQLPGIVDRYDYGYLLIEGIWRPGKDNEIEIYNGSWSAKHVHTRAIHNYVMGLCLRAGIIPWRSGRPEESVEFIVDQYRMWTEKKWHEHTAHDRVYAPASSTGGFGLRFTRRDISVTEKMALQLPGVDEKAKYIARHFKTVAGMVAATEEDWARVPWITKQREQRLLGEASAKKIFVALHGQKNEKELDQ